MKCTKHTGFTGLILALLVTGCVTAPQAEDITYTPPPPPPPPPAPTATANVKAISRVTHDPAPERWPRLNRKGTQLLFETFDLSKKDNSGWSIVLIHPGAAGRKLIAGPYASQPAWYPDGRLFVYTYYKLGAPVLVRTPVNSVGMTFISPRPLGSQDNQPDVSPDGKRIAFHTKIGKTFQVCCVDVDGGNFTVYTEGCSPRWHPGGKKLSFDNTVGEKSQCFILDLRSGQVTQLTGGNSDNSFPVWSPDGKWISFLSKRDGGKYHLFLMRADGSLITQLTKGDSQECFHDWGRDNMIYFASDAGAPNAQPKSPWNWNYADIWRLRPILPK